jgi:hypothetical protein
LKDFDGPLNFDFSLNIENDTRYKFSTDVNPYEINTKLIFLDYKIPSFASVNHIILSGFILTQKYRSHNLDIGFDNWQFDAIGNNGMTNLLDLTSMTIIKANHFVLLRSSVFPLTTAIKLNFGSTGNNSPVRRKARFYSHPKLKNLFLGYLDDQDKVFYTQSNFAEI